MAHVAIQKQTNKQTTKVFEGELCPSDLVCFEAWIINELLLLLFLFFFLLLHPIVLSDES